jgi:plastocyanin
MARSRVLIVVAVMVAILVGVPEFGVQADGAAPAMTVQTLNYVFIPDPVVIRVGRTITWVNPVNRTQHTATSDAPLSLWDSGEIGLDEKYSFTFTAAGKYPYTCTLHQAFNMFSTVGVTPFATPPSGPPGTVFTIKVATIPAPADYVYDVQKRNPVGGWQDWMTGVTSATVVFDSTGVPRGSYKFRSRLHRVSDDAASDYSPSVVIEVT